MPNCIFCKIIRGEIPSKKIHESDDLIVFYDINPKAPVHILIVPRKHLSSLIDAKDTDRELLGQLMLAANKIGRKLGIDDNGYKIVINNGKGSGQLVDHLHLHFLGGWKKLSGWEV